MSHHGKEPTAPRPWPRQSPARPGSTPPAWPPFHVLTLCTGNICRSPMAEIMLRHSLRGVPGVSVASAGTNALVGQPMPPEARAVIEGLGLRDDPPHVARQLTADLVRRSDLILALTREHRRRAVQLDPSATQRVFTLREFAFVAGHVAEADFDAAAAQLLWRQQAEGLPASPPHPARVAVGAAFTVNGVFPLADPAELDVADPFGLPLDAYAEAAVRMMPAADAIAEYFARLPGLTPARPARTAPPGGKRLVGTAPLR